MFVWEVLKQVQEYEQFYAHFIVFKKQVKMYKLVYKTYLLWLNFILGLNFISLCFKLIIIHYHAQKQKEIKFKPRIKLNHNISK